MKRQIAKIKRLIYKIKTMWKLRKTPKFMRKFMFWCAMTAYDTAEYLKRVQMSYGESLDRVARLHGIARAEGMTDNELRAKIREAVGGGTNHDRILR